MPDRREIERTVYAFLERAERYIREKDMLTHGDIVIAGVSGGADSMCLLDVLITLGKKHGWSVRTVHVHHGIRGSSADEDASYVSAYCEKEGIPCTVARFDVPAYAKRQGVSLEEGGRMVRREVFAAEMRKAAEDRSAAEEGGISPAGSGTGKPGGRVYIALAHQMDDQAETVLYQLSRGGGLAAFGGMHPVSGNVIRPLLFARRGEIEAYLRARGIAWREDETNSSDEYARNRIRHTVLPYLAENVNAEAVSHIAKAAALSQEAVSFIRERAAESYRRMTGTAAGERAEECFLTAGELAAEDRRLLPYIFLCALESVSGKRKDITAAHLSALCDLCGMEEGKQTDLPYGMRAVRRAGGILIEKRDASTRRDGQNGNGQSGMAHPAGSVVPEGRLTLALTEKFPYPVPDLYYTKWFDYDTICDSLHLKNGEIPPLEVRTRRPGDFLIIRADGARKSLSDLFTDRKIPKEERDRIPLAAAGSEILWVIGYRPCAGYTISGTTKTALRLTWEGEKCEDGKDQRFDTGRRDREENERTGGGDQQGL